MIHDNQAHYTPDMAELIDTPAEILADDLSAMGIRINPKQAAILLKRIEDEAMRRQALALGQFVSMVIEAKNPLAVVYGFAFAAGLDQLNGIKSQTEVAEKLGCTRALISHYVVEARDCMNQGNSHFDVIKFRKRNESRATYAQRATSPFLQAKIQARQKITNIKDHANH